MDATLVLVDLLIYSHPGQNLASSSRSTETPLLLCPGSLEAVAIATRLVGSPGLTACSSVLQTRHLSKRPACTSPACHSLNLAHRHAASCPACILCRRSSCRAAPACADIWSRIMAEHSAHHPAAITTCNATSPGGDHRRDTPELGVPSCP